MRKVLLVAIIALALYGIGKLILFPGYMTAKDVEKIHGYYIRTSASVDSVLQVLQKDYEFSSKIFWDKQVHRQHLPRFTPGIMFLERR